MQWVVERCAPEQASQPLGCSVSSPPVIHCGQGFYTNPQPCIVHSVYTLSSIISTLHSAYTPGSICIHFNLTIVHIYNLSSICLYFSLTSYQLVEGIVPGERFNLLFQIFVCENKPKYLFGNLISKCHVFKQIIQGGFHCGEKNTLNEIIKKSAWAVLYSGTVCLVPSFTALMSVMTA